MNPTTSILLAVIAVSASFSESQADSAKVGSGRPRPVGEPVVRRTAPTQAAIPTSTRAQQAAQPVTVVAQTADADEDAPTTPTATTQIVSTRPAPGVVTASAPKPVGTDEIIDRVNGESITVRGQIYSLSATKATKTEAGATFNRHESPGVVTVSFNMKDCSDCSGFLDFPTGSLTDLKLALGALEKALEKKILENQNTLAEKRQNEKKRLDELLCRNGHTKIENKIKCLDANYAKLTPQKTRGRRGQPQQDNSSDSADRAAIADELYETLAGLCDGARFSVVLKSSEVTSGVRKWPTHCKLADEQETRLANLERDKSYIENLKRGMAYSRHPYERARYGSLIDHTVRKWLSSVRPSYENFYSAGGIGPRTEDLEFAHDRYDKLQKEYASWLAPKGDSFEMSMTGRPGIPNSPHDPYQYPNYEHFPNYNNGGFDSTQMPHPNYSNGYGGGAGYANMGMPQMGAPVGAFDGMNRSGLNRGFPQMGHFGNNQFGGIPFNGMTSGFQQQPLGFQQPMTPGGMQFSQQFVPNQFMPQQGFGSMGFQNQMAFQRPGFPGMGFSTMGYQTGFPTQTFPAMMPTGNFGINNGFLMNNGFFGQPNMGMNMGMGMPRSFPGVPVGAPVGMNGMGANQLAPPPGTLPAPPNVANTTTQTVPNYTRGQRTL